MRKTKRLRLAVLIVGIVASVLVTQAEEPGVEEIVKLVQTQQQQVVSLKYSWAGDVLLPKGLHNSLYETEEMKPAGTTLEAPQPAEDRSVRESYSLTINGSDIRWDKQGVAWNAPEGGFSAVKRSESLVDGIAYEYNATAVYGGVGGISEVLSRVEIQPLRVAYRLFHPVLGVAEADGVTLLSWEDWNGHRCAVLEYVDDSTQKPDRYVFWAAEDLDYSIVRYHHTIEPSPYAVQAEMQYEQDDQIGWRLASWETVREPSGEIFQGVAEDMRINEPIASGDLIVAFPAGTRVADAVRGIEYVVGEGAQPEEVDRLCAAETMREFVESVPVD
ncbi:MAG: hypothetical protein R6V05_12040 [Candidatus Brocadiia bacterium]